MWSMFSLQKKVYSNQKKGHLGSWCIYIISNIQYIYIYVIFVHLYGILSCMKGNNTNGKCRLNRYAFGAFG